MENSLKNIRLNEEESFEEIELSIFKLEELCGRTLEEE